MYGLEDLPELFGVRYKNLWANASPKSSEGSQCADSVS